jgi:two-component system, cell cycle sensor histidine kinase and response regulator CckA
MHVPYDSGATLAGERNHRILIIDDNPSIHQDVRKILGAPAVEDSALDTEAAELFGSGPETLTSVAFEIDSAFQGQEGLAMVQRALDEGRPYAMTFVDVRMPPGWDGIETISRIWKSYPEMQVVICTAYSDYSWEDMVRKVGKTDSLVILKKPFDNVEVLQLAHTLTRKWTLSHRLQCHLAGLDQIVASRTQDLESANARLRKEIVDRQQAEKELGLSEERFAKAFQASPIPMAIQSLTTARYIDVNESFLAMTGYRRIQTISRTPTELQLYLDPEAPALLMLQLQEERSVRNFECRIRTQSAEIRDCVVSAEAFELSDETVALVAAQDVSEQRKLELKLRHAQKLEAVGQFAAGVAHDFNNMLTVIQGHASIQLAAANLEKDLANSLNHVAYAAERAAALTRQLLTFSRKHVVQPQLLDLNAIVRNLNDMLSRLIGEHIELRCELGDDLPAIYADESNIEQVVMNIVANARDAMHNGGQLTVQTGVVEIEKSRAERHPQARPGRHVFLRITDTGCGMNSETLGHIFEPFFTTKEVGKGSGLGLATVYGIVARQEGWIEVSSEEGRGATFEILLPVREEKVEGLPEISEDGLPGGTETILVVEDEPAVREIITYVLRMHGYHVLEAGDGPEAITLWSTQGGEVDLLVTDIVMPNGIKGNVLAQRLKAEKPELKVIFSSAYSSDFATEASPLSERISFLEKPYKPEVLVRAVRDCLDEAAPCAT